MLPRNRWFIAAALAYALLGGLVGLAWLAWARQLLAHAGLVVFASRLLPVLGWTGAEDVRFPEGATK